MEEAVEVIGLRTSLCRGGVLSKTVAWISRRLTVTTPKKPWEETVADFEARLKAACAHCNANYDLSNLCNEFPHRVRKMLLKNGDRLSE